jgi:hypothetical protein
VTTPLTTAAFGRHKVAGQYWFHFATLCTLLESRLRLALHALLAMFTLAAVHRTFALTLHSQRETDCGIPEAIGQSNQTLRH